MKPIGKNIICKKLEQVQKQGLIILPTKTDFNEFEVISLGSKFNEEVENLSKYFNAPILKG